MLCQSIHHKLPGIAKDKLPPVKSIYNALTLSSFFNDLVDIIVLWKEMGTA